MASTFPWLDHMICHLARLSIISQDPSMFVEGTLKSNLNPLEEHADEQIWHLLQSWRMKISLWSLL